MGSPASQSGLPFTRDSDTFRALQVLWEDEVKEELTYEKAESYGPNILGLVVAVAQSKRFCTSECEP